MKMIKKHMNNQTIPGKNSPPKILDSKQTVSNPAVPVSKHLTRKKNTQFEDERFYKTIFESASDAILVIDKNGEIINFNDRLAEIGGYKRAELSGKNIRSLTRIITADSLNIIVSNFFNRMAGLDVPPYEIEVLNKNGDVVNIEINARPLKKGKNIIGDLVLLRDITARKKTEKALKVSEENYRLIVENTQDLIFIENAAGEVTYISPSIKNMLGYEQSDIIGHSFRSLIHADDKSGLEKAIKHNIIHGYQNTGGVEFRVRNITGEWRWYIGRGNAVHDANGNFVNFIGIANDITIRKQVEQALFASEQNFRSSLDSSPMGVRIVDAEWHTVYANQALLDILGYKNIEELRASPPQQHYTPESLAGFIRYKEQSLRGEPLPPELKIDIVRRDGSTRHIQLFAKTVLWNGRQQQQFLYNDITEQKEIEVALRESEEKYRTIFESAYETIILIDTGGRILDFNNRLLKISGYTRDELIGKEIYKLTDLLGKENLSILVTNFLKVLSGSTMVTYQVQLSLKNGELVYLDINGVPIKKDGKVVSVLAFFRNITERMQAELQIKEQRELTDRILESTPDSMAVVGQDRRFIMINKAFERTFDLSQDSIKGKDISDIIHMPVLTDKISQVLASGSSEFELEFRMKKNNVERVYIADIISTQKNEVMAVLHDVTKEREMQERLYLTDRLASLGEMAAGIAHELNNPLTGVVALSQLLLDNDVAPEVKDDLQAISNEGQRAARVVRNMLSFARSPNLTNESIDINAIIAQVLTLRTYEHRVNDIEVTYHFGSNLPKIVADQFHIQQVFINIVLNAEQAMIESHGHGKLTITTELLKGFIRISFADDGPGIPPDVINRIFDPFFTTKEVGKGTGLGLSICYGIVTKQGGRIYAKSPPGKGAIFIVELPVNARDTRKE